MSVRVDEAKDLIRQTALADTRLTGHTRKNALRCRTWLSEWLEGARKDDEWEVEAAFYLLPQIADLLDRYKVE